MSHENLSGSFHPGDTFAELSPGPVQVARVDCVLSNNAALEVCCQSNQKKKAWDGMKWFIYLVFC